MLIPDGILHILDTNFIKDSKKLKYANLKLHYQLSKSTKRAKRTVNFLKYILFNFETIKYIENILKDLK